MLITKALICLFTHVLFLFVGLAKNFQHHQDQHQPLLKQNEMFYGKEAVASYGINILCWDKGYECHKINTSELCFYTTEEKITLIFTHICINRSEINHKSSRRKIFSNIIEVENYFKATESVLSPCDNYPVTPHLSKKGVSRLKTIVRNKVPLPLITSKKDFSRPVPKELYQTENLSVDTGTFNEKYLRIGDKIVVRVLNKQNAITLCKNFCYKSKNLSHASRNLFFKELHRFGSFQSQKNASSNDEILVKKCTYFINNIKRIKNGMISEKSNKNYRKRFSKNPSVKLENTNKSKELLNSNNGKERSYINDNERMPDRLYNNNADILFKQADDEWAKDSDIAYDALSSRSQNSNEGDNFFNQENDSWENKTSITNDVLSSRISENNDTDIVLKQIDSSWKKETNIQNDAVSNNLLSNNEGYKVLKQIYSPWKKQTNIQNDALSSELLINTEGDKVLTQIDSPWKKETNIQNDAVSNNLLSNNEGYKVLKQIYSPWKKQTNIQNDALSSELLINIEGDRVLRQIDSSWKKETNIQNDELSSELLSNTEGDLKLEDSPWRKQTNIPDNSLSNKLLNYSERDTIKQASTSWGKDIGYTTSCNNKGCLQYNPKLKHSYASLPLTKKRQVRSLKKLLFGLKDLGYEKSSKEELNIYSSTPKIIKSVNKNFSKINTSVKSLKSRKDQFSAYLASFNYNSIQNEHLNKSYESKPSNKIINNTFSSEINLRSRIKNFKANESENILIQKSLIRNVRNLSNRNLIPELNRKSRELTKTESDKTDESDSDAKLKIKSFESKGDFSHTEYEYKLETYEPKVSNQKSLDEIPIEKSSLTFIDDTFREFPSVISERYGPKEIKTFEMEGSKHNPIVSDSELGEFLQVSPILASYNVLRTDEAPDTHMEKNTENTEIENGFSPKDTETHFNTETSSKHFQNARDLVLFDRSIDEISLLNSLKDAPKIDEETFSTEQKDGDFTTNVLEYPSYEDYLKSEFIKSPFKNPLPFNSNLRTLSNNFGERESETKLIDFFTRPISEQLNILLVTKKNVLSEALDEVSGLSLHESAKESAIKNNIHESTTPVNANDGLINFGSEIDKEAGTFKEENEDKITENMDVMTATNESKNNDDALFISHFSKAEFSKENNQFSLTEKVYSFTKNGDKSSLETEVSVNSDVPDKYQSNTLENKMPRNVAKGTSPVQNGDIVRTDRILNFEKINKSFTSAVPFRTPSTKSDEASYDGGFFSSEIHYKNRAVDQNSREKTDVVSEVHETDAFAVQITKKPGFHEQHILLTTNEIPSLKSLKKSKGKVNNNDFNRQPEFTMRSDFPTNYFESTVQSEMNNKRPEKNYYVFTSAVSVSFTGDNSNDIAESEISDLHYKNYLTQSEDISKIKLTTFKTDSDAERTNMNPIEKDDVSITSGITTHIPTDYTSDGESLDYSEFSNEVPIKLSGKEMPSDAVLTYSYLSSFSTEIALSDILRTEETASFKSAIEESTFTIDEKDTFGSTPHHTSVVDDVYGIPFTEIRKFDPVKNTIPLSESSSGVSFNHFESIETESFNHEFPTDEVEKGTYFITENSTHFKDINSVNGGRLNVPEELSFTNSIILTNNTKNEDLVENNYPTFRSSEGISFPLDERNIGKHKVGQTTEEGLPIFNGSSSEFPENGEMESFPEETLTNNDSEKVSHTSIRIPYNLHEDSELSTNTWRTTKNSIGEDQSPLQDGEYITLLDEEVSLLTEDIPSKNDTILTSVEDEDRQITQSERESSLPNESVMPTQNDKETYIFNDENSISTEKNDFLVDNGSSTDRNEKNTSSLNNEVVQKKEMPSSSALDDVLNIDTNIPSENDTVFLSVEDASNNLVNEFTTNVKRESFLSNEIDMPTQHDKEVHLYSDSNRTNRDVFSSDNSGSTIENEENTSSLNDKVVHEKEMPSSSALDDVLNIDTNIPSENDTVFLSVEDASNNLVNEFTTNVKRESSLSNEIDMPTQHDKEVHLYSDSNRMNRDVFSSDNSGSTIENEENTSSLNDKVVHEKEMPSSSVLDDVLNIDTNIPSENDTVFLSVEDASNNLVNEFTTNVKRESSLSNEIDMPTPHDKEIHLYSDSNRTDRDDFSFDNAGSTIENEKNTSFLDNKVVQKKEMSSSGVLDEFLNTVSNIPSKNDTALSSVDASNTLVNEFTTNVKKESSSPNEIGMPTNNNKRINPYSDSIRTDIAFSSDKEDSTIGNEENTSSFILENEIPFSNEFGEFLNHDRDVPSKNNTILPSIEDATNTLVNEFTTGIKRESPLLNENGVKTENEKEINLYSDSNRTEKDAFSSDNAGSNRSTIGNEENTTLLNNKVVQEKEMSSSSVFDEFLNADTNIPFKTDTILPSVEDVTNTLVNEFTTRIKRESTLLNETGVPTENEKGINLYSDSYRTDSDVSYLYNTSSTVGNEENTSLLSDKVTIGKEMPSSSVIDEFLNPGTEAPGKNGTILPSIQDFNNTLVNEFTNNVKRESSLSNEIYMPTQYDKEINLYSDSNRTVKDAFSSNNAGSTIRNEENTSLFVLENEMSFSSEFEEFFNQDTDISSKNNTMIPSVEDISNTSANELTTGMKRDTPMPNETGVLTENETEINLFSDSIGTDNVFSSDNRDLTIENEDNTKSFILEKEMLSSSVFDEFLNLETDSASKSNTILPSVENVSKTLVNELPTGIERESSLPSESGMSTQNETEINLFSDSIGTDNVFSSDNRDLTIENEDNTKSFILEKEMLSSSVFDEFLNLETDSASKNDTILPSVENVSKTLVNEFPTGIERKSSLPNESGMPTQNETEINLFSDSIGTDNVFSLDNRDLTIENEDNTKSFILEKEMLSSSAFDEFLNLETDSVSKNDTILPSVEDVSNTSVNELPTGIERESSLSNESSMPTQNETEINLFSDSLVTDNVFSSDNRGLTNENEENNNSFNLENEMFSSSSIHEFLNPDTNIPSKNDTIFSSIEDVSNTLMSEFTTKVKRESSFPNEIGIPTESYIEKKLYSDLVRTDNISSSDDGNSTFKNEEYTSLLNNEDIPEKETPLSNAPDVFFKPYTGNYLYTTDEHEKKIISTNKAFFESSEKTEKYTDDFLFNSINEINKSASTLKNNWQTRTETEIPSSKITYDTFMASDESLNLGNKRNTEILVSSEKGIVTSSLENELSSANFPLEENDVIDANNETPINEIIRTERQIISSSDMSKSSSTDIVSDERASIKDKTTDKTEIVSFTVTLNEFNSIKQKIEDFTKGSKLSSVSVSIEEKDKMTEASKIDTVDELTNIEPITFISSNESKLPPSDTSVSINVAADKNLQTSDSVSPNERQIILSTEDTKLPTIDTSIDVRGEMDENIITTAQTGDFTYTIPRISSSSEISFRPSDLLEENYATDKEFSPTDTMDELIPLEQQTALSLDGVKSISFSISSDQIIITNQEHGTTDSENEITRTERQKLLTSYDNEVVSTDVSVEKNSKNDATVNGVDESIYTENQIFTSNEGNKLPSATSSLDKSTVADNEYTNTNTENGIISPVDQTLSSTNGHMLSSTDNFSEESIVPHQENGTFEQNNENIGTQQQSMSSSADSELSSDSMRKNDITNQERQTTVSANTFIRTEQYKILFNQTVVPDGITDSEIETTHTERQVLPSSEDNEQSTSKSSITIKDGEITYPVDELTHTEQHVISTSGVIVSDVFSDSGNEITRTERQVLLSSEDSKQSTSKSSITNKDDETTYPVDELTHTEQHLISTSGAIVPDVISDSGNEITRTERQVLPSNEDSEQSSNAMSKNSITNQDDETTGPVEELTRTEQHVISSSDITVPDVITNSNNEINRTERQVLPSSEDTELSSNSMRKNITHRDDETTYSVSEFTHTERHIIPSNEITVPDVITDSEIEIIRTERQVVPSSENSVWSSDATREYSITNQNDEIPDSVELSRTERQILTSSQAIEPSVVKPVENSDTNIKNNPTEISPDKTTLKIPIESNFESKASGRDLEIPTIDGTNNISTNAGLNANDNVKVTISTNFNPDTPSQETSITMNSNIKPELSTSEVTSFAIDEIEMPSKTSPKEIVSSIDEELVTKSTTVVSITQLKTEETAMTTKTVNNTSSQVFLSPTAPKSATVDETIDSTKVATETTRKITSSSTTSDLPKTSSSKSTMTSEKYASTVYEWTPETSTVSTFVSSTTSTTVPTTSTRPIRQSTTTLEIISLLNENNSIKVDGTTVSISEASRIPFHFTIDADYDRVVGTKKAEFEENLTQQLAVVMRIPFECLQSLEVSKGSIKVNFELVPNSQKGHMADEQAMKAAAEELKRKIDNGELKITDLDGSTLVIIPIDPPTKAPVVNQTEHITLILGVVIGAFILTVISVAIAAIIIKRKANGIHRLSPIEEARSKLPSYREIPFQEALFMKGPAKNKLILGKYCYNTGKWLGPGPEPVSYQPPDSVVYRPPTDSEVRQTPRPPTAVRERLRNDWELDWDSMVFSR